MDSNETLSLLANESDYQCSGATDEELELYATLSFWLGGKSILNARGNETTFTPWVSECITAIKPDLFLYDATYYLHIREGCKLSGNICKTSPKFTF